MGFAPSDDAVRSNDVEGRVPLVHLGEAHIQRHAVGVGRRRGVHGDGVGDPVGGRGGDRGDTILQERPQARQLVEGGFDGVRQRHDLLDLGKAPRLTGERR